MKVFVAGATGVAGRRAVRELVAAGDSVVAVARSEERSQLVSSLGATPARVDLFDRAAVRQAVVGCDAVVNLTTKIPSLGRMMLPGAWSENDRIRKEVSRNLVDAALESVVGAYVQESLAFMYPDRGDEWIDETVPADPPAYARSTLEAEDHAARFSEGGGRGIVLRFGQFYAPDATHTRSMIATARRGLSPFPGPPEAFFPVIHADDVASAVVAALDAPAGTYNVVDDEPLPQRDLGEALARALGRKAGRFPPAGLARLGGSTIRMLMRSQRVSNRRFRDTAGWTPKFPDAREGFVAVANEALSRC